ncbi:hypothetical protein ACFQ48_15645 [Hymenobacter caeli]|uniref:DUF4890 domain-containing protein n=1 Tax=Hymenobacter caeli TaxID=2735894 RepID=A0ABX2FRP5_9BACT|nr:hypothetical protein [Hymenobacter caeli]NRT19503.1 hypothetical protein [Hymenobacter caeli]
MKRFFFLLLGATVALAAPAARAQAVVKTKTKADGQTVIKTKTTAPADPAEAPLPTSASAEARANALTANMQQNLGLSPQQTEKVRAINQRGVAAVENARARYRNDPGKLKGFVEGVGQSRLEALKEVLTAAQFDKYQRKREEKMGVPNVQGVQGNPAPGLGNE